MKLKECASALETFERVLEKKPDSDTAWYYRGGMILYTLQRQEEAAKAFESASRLNPGLYTAFEYRAKCLFETGQYEAAFEAFEAVLEKDPENLSALEKGQFASLN